MLILLYCFWLAIGPRATSCCNCHRRLFVVVVSRCLSMPCVCEREKEQCCCCLCCCCLFPLRICRPPLPSSSASTLDRETEREGKKGPSCQHSSWLSAGACQVARNLCPWSSFIFPIVFHVLSAIQSNRKSKFCCFCRDQKCNAFSRSPESSNYRRPYETQLRLSLYCA